MIKIVAAIKRLKLTESRIDEPRCIEQFFLKRECFNVFRYVFHEDPYPRSRRSVVPNRLQNMIRYFLFHRDALFKCLRHSEYRCLAQPSSHAIPEITPSPPREAVPHHAPCTPTKKKNTKTNGRHP